MKTLSIILFVATIFVGCGGHDSHSSGEGLNITPDQLSTVIDPVCKMSLENHVIADTSIYKGKTYGFCNPGCKEAFVEDLDKYLADL